MPIHVKLQCSTPAVVISVAVVQLYGRVESPLTQSFGLGLEGSDTTESAMKTNLDTLSKSFSFLAAAYIGSGVSNLADMNLTPSVWQAWLYRLRVFSCLGI